MSDLDLGVLNGSSTHAGFLESTDPTDTYRFGLDGNTSANLSIANFGGEVGWELRDSIGNSIESGYRFSDSSPPDAIVLPDLPAGDYTLDVRGISGEADYRLALNTNTADPLTGLPVKSGYFIVDDTGEVKFDFQLDGGRDRSEVAIFSLTGMETLEMGSDEWMREAARRALTDSNEGHIVISDASEGAKSNPPFLADNPQNNGEYRGVKTFEMTPGDAIAVMVVPDGTVEKVRTKEVLGRKQRPFFSIAAANPDGEVQLAQLERSGDYFLALEDRPVRRSDRDYDDLVVRVEGMTPVGMVPIEVVIDEGENWIDRWPVDIDPPVNTPPEVLELTLETGETLSLTGRVNDVDGIGDVQEVVFSLETEDGESIAELSATEFTPDGSGGGNFSLDYSLDDFEPGNYTVRAIATDLTGANSAEVIERFTIDEPPIPNQAPQFREIELEDTRYTLEDSLELSGRVYDANGTEDIETIAISLESEDGTVIPLIPSNLEPTGEQGEVGFSLDYPLDDLDLGTYTVRAIATDKAGESSNTVVSSFLVADPNADNQSPESLEFLVDRYYSPGETVYVVGRTIDPDGAEDIAKVDFWLQSREGGLLTNIATVTEFDPYSLDPTEARFGLSLGEDLEVGHYNLLAFARDRAGEVAVSETLPLTVLSLPRREELDDRVKWAIEAATNLDSYNPDLLAGTREWVVSVCAGDDPSDLAVRVGATNFGTTGSLPNTYFWEFPADVTPEEVLERISEYGAIEFAYPQVFYPAEFLSPYPWHIENTGQVGGTVGADIRAKAAWERHGVDGSGVVIGVVDDGFDYEHPNLSGGYRSDLSWDFDRNDDNPGYLLSERVRFPSAEAIEANTDPERPQRFRLLDEKGSPKLDGGLFSGVLSEVTLELPLIYETAEPPEVTLVSPWGTRLEIPDVINGGGRYTTDAFNGETPNNGAGSNKNNHWRLEIVNPTNLDAVLLPWTLELTTTNGHGTQVAGVAAGRLDGDRTLSGIATGAGWAGLRIGADGFVGREIAQALSHQQDEIDIYNNSWGGGFYLKPVPLGEWELQDGTERGRGGTGSNFVFAAGNDGDRGGNTNYTSFANSRHTTAVAALDLTGRQAVYSTPGASVLVSAYSEDTYSFGLDAAERDRQIGKNRTTTSTIVADEVSGKVTDVEILVDLERDRNDKLDNPQKDREFYENLELVLVSPSGREVKLLSEVPFDSKPKDRDSIRLSNLASRSLPTQNVPFFGRFRPQESLANFEEGNGDWTLKVINNGKHKGILKNWGLFVNVGGIHTTDIQGDAGATPIDANYSFNGTSAATPMVSGTMALMLEANPDLTWRDVQHILVTTADTNDPEDEDWAMNGAGYAVNHKYGFGAVNADRAVEAAKNWTLVDKELEIGSDEIFVVEIIRDGDANGVPASEKTQVEFTEEIAVEWVEVNLNVSHGDRDNLNVELIHTAPDGTETRSQLASPFRTPSNDIDVYEPWVYTSARHWGESSEGTWELKVSDETGGGDPGVWVSWDLKLFGTQSETGVSLPVPPDATYVENTPLPLFRDESGDPIEVQSPPGDTITVTLALSDPSLGTIAAAEIPGVTVEFDEDIEQWSIEGDVDAVNDWLAEVEFVPTDNSIAPVEVDVTVANDNRGNRYRGTVTLTGTAGIPIPVVEIAMRDAEATETGNAAQFIVSRDAATDTDLAVDYEIAGDATNGTDYLPLTGTVTIRAGETTATIPVVPIYDYDGEADETVELRLTDGGDYNLADSSNAIATIANSTPTDFYGSFVYTNPDTGNLYLLSEADTWLGAQEQAEALGGNLVAIDNAAEQDWLVETFGTEARFIGLTDSEIYNREEGDLQWVNGQPLTYTNWHPSEPNNQSSVPEGEDFSELFQLDTYAWNDLRHDLKFVPGIIEIDPDTLAQPIVNITTTDSIVGEDGDAGQVVFSRIGNLDGDLTVNYTLAGDTTNGSDYPELTGTIVIPAGESLVTMPMRALADDVLEDPETAIVNLAAGNYAIGTKPSTQLTIADLNPLNRIANEVLDRNLFRPEDWIERWQNGESLADLRIGIIDSARDENDVFEAETKIGEIYQEVLGREATAAEVATGRSRLETDTSLSQIRQELSGATNFIDTNNEVYVNPETGNRYFFTTPDTWLGAQEQAAAAGGNLVTINDAAQNDWLVSTFDLESRWAWMGITDSPLYGGTEGEHRWVSGEPISYINWGAGEPNNALNIPEGEDFGEVGSAAGTWNDRLSQQEVLRPGIVEIPAVSFFNPDTPYLSFDDSPFKDENFAYFHLEDFEDDALNTPGVTVSNGRAFQTSDAMDSVDADDGTIDGSGSDGQSWWSWDNSLSFTFDEAVLGELPTSAGIVVTDIVSGPVVLEAFGVHGQSLGTTTTEMTNLVQGRTADDRFLGITHKGGISTITISNSIGNIADFGWEVDHLQYGLANNNLTELFTDTEIELQGDSFGSVAVDWGDYDSDGDLDLLMVGNPTSTVYRNDGGSFTDIGADLAQIRQGPPPLATWGDYDNDGDLDILLAGQNAVSVGITKIYRNDGGNFTDIEADLKGILNFGSVDWGDYDNDGDLDILLAGWDNSATGPEPSTVYRNDGGNFTDIAADLPPATASSVAWGDYDNDRDLDILITGTDDTSNNFSKIYRNDGGNFTDIEANLEGFAYGSVDWGDYDSDGDLDLLLTGSNNSSPIVSKVYRNDDGNFSDINGFPLGGGDDATWGDYDNDGDLDVLLTGGDSSGLISKVYRNDNGSFTETQTNLKGVGGSSLEWGDYDRDGDLDILLAGQNADGVLTEIVSKTIYRNNTEIPNTAPTAPTSLNSQVSSSTINGDSSNSTTLSWTPATDAETPQAGLTYNLRVGSTPGGSQVMSAMSLADGTRQIADIGNVNHNTEWRLDNLEPGTYYWTVQAVDSGLLGSEFATEGSFTVPFPTENLTVTVNRVRELDNVDISSEADFRTQVGINGASWQSGVLHNQDEIFPNWQFSQPVTGPTVPISIALQDEDTIFGSFETYAEVDISPVSDETALDLTVDALTGEIIGPGINGTLGEELYARGDRDTDFAEIWFTVDRA
ncbi:MAG: S8 family serine peptidase [Cyanobacteriota bacterium]|nr:S8 family serine peptidase [Cyanobacteriota bacterium]